jgi:hypothetical protein
MNLDEEEAIRLRQHYKDHLESVDSKNKNLLTLLTTVFAIIISFNDIKYTDKFLFWCYLVLIVVFLISILSGIALLYSKQELIRKTVDNMLFVIQNKETLFREKSVYKTPLPKYLEIANIVFEITSYLSIVLLAIFTILKAIYKS